MRIKSINENLKRPQRETNSLQLFGLLKSMRSPGGDSAWPFVPVDFGLVLLGYRILAEKCVLSALAKRPYQTRETNNLQLFGLIQSIRSAGNNSTRQFGPVESICHSRRSERPKITSSAGGSRWSRMSDRRLSLYTIMAHIRLKLKSCQPLQHVTWSPSLVSCWQGVLRGTGKIEGMRPVNMDQSIRSLDHTSGTWARVKSITGKFTHLHRSHSKHKLQAPTGH
jgi:hypothetical protein